MLNAYTLLCQNYELLQQIHNNIHVIKQLNCKQALTKPKWTEYEDQLLDFAQGLFGTNYQKISKVISSKTVTQVYQRLRYIREKQQRSLQ
ncbi:SANT/Myb_domain [Hexamita inflata]|uniref:SANT/Myb domain n=1 Tax=Hexamita inflata TaxID=28002 RepID=A0AA86V0K9_9EUKA|nr:SANT/Myb domain [Hexamita inflata]